MGTSFWDLDNYTIKSCLSIAFTLFIAILPSTYNPIGTLDAGVINAFVHLFQRLSYENFVRRMRTLGLMKHGENSVNCLEIL